MSGANTKGHPPSIGPLNELVTYHLRRAQVNAFGNFAHSMQDTQLTPGQFGVLCLIASNEGLSQSAVARSLGVERSTMVAVIDGLENRGLVLRKPSPTDRRSNALVLSEEGQNIYERAVASAKGGDQEMMSGLTRAEADQLMTLLRKLNHSAGLT